MSDKTLKQTTIQLPELLRRELIKIAKKEDRSLAAQVRIFLADSVTRKHTENGRDAA